MHEKILTLAKAIVRPAEEEEALLDALCTAAEAELTGRLREDVSPEDCGSFPCAAALLAAAGLLPCRDGGDVERFTAGEVSLQTGGNGGLCAAAGLLRRQAAAMMAPYWADDSFAFAGVRG